jgi:hypothetical protein
VAGGVEGLDGFQGAGIEGGVLIVVFALEGAVAVVECLYLGV